MTATTEPAEVETAEEDEIPGGTDVWVFVMFESLVFASYFCVYLYFRTQDEASSSKRNPS